ncbi:MAG: VCBS repeat-containing protein, partial [Thermodesulfobacteriota bacterium]|nr:VCBS repeat-containing protein [Thermodesulfobacteriota bacterium]
MYRMSIFLITFFLTMLIYGSAESTDLFLPYQTYPVGSYPEAVAIGDVNSDGNNDVVMTTGYYSDPDNDYRIHVFLQNPLGELEPPVKYLTNGTYTSRPESIDIGDLNGDGKADVVVGNSGDSIEIFIQNSSGELAPGITYSTVNSNSVKIGDLNNDGLLDVVGIGWGTNTADVFLQNANGTMDPPITYNVTHGGYDEVVVGDVNNDGLHDIVVMSGQTYADNIGILYQENDGDFGSPIYYDLGGNEITNGIAIGDINDDFLQDIVVSYGGNVPNSFIGSFSQNEMGTLEEPISYSSYNCPEPVEIADVNFDGKADVLTAHGGWNALGVYIQDDVLGLLPEVNYSLPYASHYNPQ